MSKPQIEIAAKNFKSFGEIKRGLQNIFPINLVIGRNNTGKSALLDIVHYAYDCSSFEKTYGKPINYKHKGKLDPEISISISKIIEMDDVEAAFKESLKNNKMSQDIYEELRELVNHRILAQSVTREGPNHQVTSVEVDAPYRPEVEKHFRHLGFTIRRKLTSRAFKRISAERNILPENAGLTSRTLQNDGIGATNIAYNIAFNNTRYDASFLENILLNDLNAIYEPDGKFERILLRQDENGQKWEIFLVEKTKGMISLSDSGSGLKTIILVLINLILMPVIEGKNLSQYAFGFEELENNLHPGLQRRLLKYLERKALENGCIFFLTTHSNVIIDLFANNRNAQIIHVTHDGECAKTKTVNTYIDGKNVLDDLDFRASDMLQTNGIVWVEGVSDRIYINRWIELYCNEKKKPIPIENVHYSFLEYGGKCLSHFDFSQDMAGNVIDEDMETLIEVTKVNTNHFVVLDSDKSKSNSEIRETKRRVISECSEENSWLTAGREIENYLPLEAFGFQLRRYSSISKIYKKRNGAVFNKKEFALSAIKRIDNSNWRMLDIESQVEKLVNKIWSWNPANN